MRTYYGKSCAVPPALKSGNFICPCISLAADPDGTFAVARMQPVSRGAVQIAAVVAARPRGGLPCRPPHVYTGVGRPSLSTLACPVPQVLYRRWARMVTAGWQLAGSP